MSVCLTISILSRKHIKRMIVLQIVVTIGLLMNALAPGYRVRADEISYGYSLSYSIIFAFIQTLKLFNSYSLFQTMFFVFIVVVFVIINVNKISLEMKHPIIDTFVIIGVYTTQFIPPLYAIGFAETPRQLNIAYFSYLLVVMAITLIWCTYARDFIKLHFTFFGSIAKKGVHCLIILFITSILGTGDLNKITSIKALRSMQNNELSYYCEQRDVWIEICESNNDVVYLPELIKPPQITDPWATGVAEYDWAMNGLKNYYGLKEIHIIPITNHLSDE